MIRKLFAAMCLTGVLVIPVVVPTPAPACGYIRVPVDVNAEIAAIEKALPRAKLTGADREKVMQLLETARKGRAARTTADFERALADTMQLLGLERIFKKQGCMTIRLPVVTS